MRKQQNFLVYRLEYLKEAMTPFGTYYASSFDEIENVISHLHISFSKKEGILSCKQSYQYIKTTP